MLTFCKHRHKITVRAIIHIHGTILEKNLCCQLLISDKKEKTIEPKFLWAEGSCFLDDFPHWCFLIEISQTLVFIYKESSHNHLKWQLSATENAEDFK